MEFELKSISLGEQRKKKCYFRFIFFQALEKYQNKNNSTHLDHLFTSSIVY